MCLLLDPSTTAARCTRLCIATCTISPSPGVMQPGPGQPDDDEATDHSHDDHGAPHSTAAMQARSPQPWLQTRGSPYSPGPTSWLPNTGRLRHTVADLARPGWRCRTGWQVVGTCCGQVRGQMLDVITLECRPRLRRLDRPHRSRMLLAGLVPPVTTGSCGRGAGLRPISTARTCPDRGMSPRS